MIGKHGVLFEFHLPGDTADCWVCGWPVAYRDMEPTGFGDPKARTNTCPRCRKQEIAAHGWVTVKPYRKDPPWQPEPTASAAESSSSGATSQPSRLRTWWSSTLRRTRSSARTAISSDTSPDGHRSNND